MVAAPLARPFFAAAAIVALGLPAISAAAQHDASPRAEPAAKRLPRSTPEAEGVPSASIAAFLEAADREVAVMHGFLLLRHGRVVAEAWRAPGAAAEPHVMWSVSKSFTSTAVGLAIAEGKLTVEDRVLRWFPDSGPAEPAENLEAMRVRDLLTMTAGHRVQFDPRQHRDIVAAFLRHPVPFEPGTHFLYNTPASYMLSAIVQQATGETVLDYLTPRLFEPLGIEKPRWDTCALGRSLGGYGLFLTTEDLAKFGQLYLQRGVWNGQRILAEEWVAEATSRRVPTGGEGDSQWGQGYGYQFWRCLDGAYRADGRDGQFCIVLPEQDAVVVLTAETADMGNEIGLVWRHLLPAFRPEPLDPDPTALAKLRAIAARGASK
ncbi:MAG: serine hydrolase [Planctomycetes bacterium]|nr:serine hydrolase [Planctomycetota bacterium]